jgi:hypothetical protein
VRKVPERKPPHRLQCYLIPVGGDSLDFIRVQASKKPDAKLIKALQDLARVAGKRGKEPKRVGPKESVCPRS